MKKMAVAIVSLGFFIAFTGCKWRVPETVSVKSKADYSFSLGTFEKEFDTEMDMDTMLGNAGTTHTTYDYFPGEEDKNVQQYIIETKIYDNLLVSKAVAENFSVDEIDCSLISFVNTSDTVGLDFNPATMLAGMTSAFGEDVAGKIEFDSVPMYLYCETIDGVKLNVNLRLFYGDVNKDELTLSPPVTPVEINKVMEKTPRPVYKKNGETVITDLEDEENLGKFEIASIMNAKNIPDGAQLCLNYTVNSLTGTIRKADVPDEGVSIVIYAVIALPMRFNVTDELEMDLNKMAEESGSGSSSGSSEDSEDMSKYFSIIDSVSIKYVAYKLPFYSTSGMNLGVDLVGDSDFQWAKLSIVDKDKTITESDKSVLSLPYTTVQKMKDNSNLKPNIHIRMDKNTLFSVPREKGVEMNVELNLKTDGILQLK